MGKRKKSPNKDDTSWIEPETKKVKKTTAKCAQTKGNTQILVKKHEKLIRTETNALKRAKVKRASNNHNPFQIKCAQSEDMEVEHPEVEVTQGDRVQEELHDLEDPVGTVDIMVGTVASSPMFEDCQVILE